MEQALESEPLRLAMRLLEGVDEAGSLTTTEMAGRFGYPRIAVKRAVVGLFRAGCLAIGSRRRGHDAYVLGRTRFAKYLALREGRGVRTSAGLDPVERAALAAAMKFVRSWPKATGRGSQEGLVSRLVKNLVPLSSS